MPDFDIFFFFFFDAIADVFAALMLSRHFIFSYFSSDIIFAFLLLPFFAALAVYFFSLIISFRFSLIFLRFSSLSFFFAFFSRR